MSNDDPLDTLATFCTDNDLVWNTSIRDRFEEYLALLEKFNSSMNLIGTLGRREIVHQLLVDSLAPAALRTPTGSLLDVGTGAGLPGIPLKIAFPSLTVTLVEPRRKRSTFLRIARTRLDLEDVAIERSRVEAVDLDPHDYVISKAFRPPDEWLPIAAEYVSDDGVVVCLTSESDRPLVDEGADASGLTVESAVDDLAELGLSRSGASTRSIVVLTGHGGQ